MQPENIPSEKTARRIGNQVSIIILALVFSCFVSFIFLFSADGIKLLQTTLDLQFNGVTTTGTVSEVKEFPSGSAAFPQSKYELTVSFEANGTTYNVISKMQYEPLDHSWVGETVEVIYNPEDPNIAMINNFNERWMIPIGEALP